MRILARRALIPLFAYLTFLTPQLPAQESSTALDSSRTTDTRQWLEDLDYLAGHLRRLHADPFHSVSEQQFDAAVATLRQKIPTLSDDAVAVGLARLVASIGDGHTRISASAKIRATPYPLQLRAFPGGLYVVASPPESHRVLGARLVAIDGVPAEEVLKAVGEITSGDNALNRLDRVTDNILIPTYLHGLGFVPDPEHATFTFEDLNGERFDRTLHPIRRSSVRWHHVYDDATHRSLFLEHPEKTFWYKYLPKTRTLYVQVNAVRDGPEQSMAAFYDEVLNRADSEDVKRLVLDLRLNRGGNNSLNWSLIYGLVRTGWAERHGSLFVIIGRRTFSAAGHLATKLDLHTDAIFVGEPTGAAPNHYGDAKPFFLPNSGLRIAVSTLYWQNSLPWDTRRWVAPELAAAPTWEEYRAGFDPALAAILDYEPTPSLADQLHEILIKQGLKAAREAYDSFIAEPVHKWVDTEPALNRLGYRLLYDEDRVDDAIAIMRLNVEQHSESANAYDSLGEAYLKAGNKKLALKAYREAQQRNPRLWSSVLAAEKLEAAGHGSTD